MIEWERIDGSMPGSQSLKRSGALWRARRRLSGGPRGSGSEYIGIIVRDTSLPEACGNGLAAGRAAYRALGGAAGKWAAAMWGRDEDRPAHLRHRLVEERLLHEPTSSVGPMTWSMGRVQTVCQSRGPPLWTIIFARMPPRLWPTTTIRSKAASVPSGSKARRARRRDCRSKWAEYGMESPLA